MAHNYGAVGIATVTSASQIATGPIRVFDIMMVNETNGGKILAYNGTATGGVLGVCSGSPYITVLSGNALSFNSNAGIRFDAGCFVGASACSAIVNYITEF